MAAEPDAPVPSAVSAPPRSSRRAGRWRSAHTPARWLRGLVGAVVLAAAACGGDDDGPTGTGDSIVGTYTLRSVNGDNVPTVVEDDEFGRLEILSGSITLNANQTFTNLLRARFTDGGLDVTQDIRLEGTYTRQGSTLTLVDPDEEGNGTATYSDGTLTFSDGEVTLVYRR